MAESRLVRMLRFGRALVVGSGATLTDFSVFTTCLRAIGMAPTSASLGVVFAEWRLAVARAKRWTLVPRDREPFASENVGSTFVASER